MSASEERFKYLLDKYINRSCTWEEYQELFSYIEKDVYKDVLYRYMDEQYVMTPPEKDRDNERLKKIYHRIQRVKAARGGVFPVTRLMVAAAVFLFTCVVVLLWISRPKPEYVTNNKAGKKKNISQENKVILTLGDGSKISLTDVPNGEIARQQGVRVTKNKAGQIIYKIAGTETADGERRETPVVSYNTITTPVGSQYQLLLPDGSEVWLNSASSFKFPAAFTGEKRTVFLTGEAYFEVAKDKSKPFEVLAGESRVEVLGTHFNVMAYNDEPFTETTLLEGAVRVNHGGLQKVLEPGQQARFTPGDNDLSVVNADTDEAIAWKNNLFVFENTGIDQVMRRIKRWYNVEVAYKGEKPEINFTGVIPRNKNVSDVLNMLQSTDDVLFRIDGNKITVEKRK